MGLRHALEADHVLAVATLVDNNNSSEAMKQGLVWGIGHTVTLLVFGIISLSFSFLLTENTGHILELIVGIMLIVLGGDLLRKIYRDRPHIHVHQHDGGVNHIHFHTHKLAESPLKKHNNQSHIHNHVKVFPVRALLIGVIHGLAGSSVLIILTLNTIQSPLLGITYILVFGLGSIISMALMSLVIAIPVRFSLKNMHWVYGALRGAIATMTLIFGVFIVYQSGVASGILVL